MPRIEEKIEVSVARADVFKFCHDVKQRPQWDEQVDNVEILSSGPLRLGSLVRVDARQGGAVFTWDAEVAAYTFLQTSRVRVLDAAKTSPFGRGSELIWEFESVGTGTRLTWVWDYKPNGFMARIMDGLGRRSATRRAIRRSLANLKKMVEAGARAGAGSRE
jgi:uncharacterized membrane protein